MSQSGTAVKGSLKPLEVGGDGEAQSGCDAESQSGMALIGSLEHASDAS